MSRVFLGLGSNQGDRWKLLREAVASLPDVVAVSPVYETDPVGGPAGQGRRQHDSGVTLPVYGAIRSCARLGLDCVAWAIPAGGMSVSERLTQRL